jgi:hypothetical protein
VCARLVVVERQPAISQQFFDFLLRCFFGTWITFPRSQSRRQCANPNVIRQYVDSADQYAIVCVNNTYPTRLFIELCCRPLYTRPWLRIFTITRTKKNRKKNSSGDQKLDTGEWDEFPYLYSWRVLQTRPIQSCLCPFLFPRWHSVNAVKKRKKKNERGNMRSCWREDEASDLMTGIHKDGGSKMRLTIISLSFSSRAYIEYMYSIYRASRAPSSSSSRPSHRRALIQ